MNPTPQQAHEFTSRVLGKVEGGLDQTLHHIREITQDLRTRKVMREHIVAGTSR